MLKNMIVEVSMITALAKILLDDSISDNIREIKLNGLKSLYSYLRHYEESGYDNRLIINIAEKKIEMIQECTSKTEMSKIIKPRCPHYNGNRFIPDKYNVVEEELIYWSETSLQAPLNEVGFKRYMELFKLVFPEKAIEICS